MLDLGQPQNKKIHKDLLSDYTRLSLLKKIKILGKFYVLKQLLIQSSSRIDKFVFMSPKIIKKKRRCKSLGSNTHE